MENYPARVLSAAQHGLQEMGAFVPVTGWACGRRTVQILAEKRGRWRVGRRPVRRAWTWGHVVCSVETDSPAGEKQEVMPMEKRGKGNAGEENEEDEEGEGRREETIAQEDGVAERHSQEDSKERARRKRAEAERLELMAEKAMLDVERKELEAERKRLELEKIKIRGGKLSPPKEAQPPAAEQRPKVNSATSATSEPKVAPMKTGLPSVTGGGPRLPQKVKEMIQEWEYRGISDEDITILKEKVLSIKNFYVTDVEKSPFDARVVFRGNLRMSPKDAMEEITKAAEETGISKRLSLFLLKDPSEENPRPCVVALPVEAMPNRTGPTNVVLASVAALITMGTTFAYGIGIFGLSPEFINQLTQGNLDETWYTLPISLGALAIAWAHEIGHRISAAFHKVKLGLPYFVPSLQIGLYGTITPLESYPRNRTELFDVAVAGPLAGIAVSLVTLILGLAITASGALADWYPQIPSNLFHASLLMGTLADILLPPGFREQATLAVHPLIVVGFSGMIVNALQLIPIGRLDGGRIVQSLVGRKTAGIVTSITLILQGFASILGNSPLLLFWGLICIFLQRESDFPCQDDITEPGFPRSLIGLAMLLVMFTTLCPFPDSLVDILGNLY